MEKFFLTILHSWGSDTPQEVFWGLNDLIEYAKTKGFVTTNYFDDPLDYADTEPIHKVNEQLIKELSEFFNKLK
jgi:hypothetical protein